VLAAPFRPVAAHFPRNYPTPYGIHMSRFTCRISSIVMVGLLSLVGFAAQAQQVPLACDVDNNGVIDSRDIALITAARNTAAGGPTDPRDPNRDGTINVLDARFCATICTFALCAKAPAIPAPVANAGADQQVAVGATVELSGSASSSARGDALTYKWSLISVPTGSTAVLANPTALRPKFVADQAGLYEAELQVTDAHAVVSLVATVLIGAGTAVPPVANPGIYPTASIGGQVTLDATHSTDVSGAPLIDTWTFILVPSNSTASLSNAGALNPTFTTDLSGQYYLQLNVLDANFNSTSAKVVVDTQARTQAPIANAGPAQSAPRGQTVVLDGSRSSAGSGASITAYQWVLLLKPVGSVAQLASASSPQSSLVIDVPGDYVAQLIVTANGLVSQPATVLISTNDVPPIANAGLSQTVFVGDTTFLQGTGTASDGNPLTYRWSLIDTPLGFSPVPMVGANTATPNFVPTNPGPYVAQLVVNNGHVDSAPSTTVVQASTPTTADLSIAQSPSTSTPSVGGTVQLTIIVNNLGRLDATAATVSDLLPTGLQLTGAVATQGTYSSATGIWTVGALANGSSARLVLTATPTAAGALTNAAAITASTPRDPNAANNVATVSLVVQPSVADLAITQTASTTAPVVGANLQLTVNVSNLGPSNATNATVSDLLPAGLQLVSAVPSQGSYNSSNGIWAVGALANGAGVQLVITAVATTAVSSVNTATITASTPTDPNGANNVASITISPQQAANLTVVTSVSNSAPVVGSNVVFTTTVTNTGPAAASGAQVADLLPSGFKVVSAQAGAGSYNAASGVWSIGALANGASVTLVVTATVLPTGSYTDTATVSASNSLNTGAGTTSTVVITPTSPPSVQITGPAAGTLIAPATVSLNISASSRSGVIARLALFDGATLLQTIPVNQPAVNFAFSLTGVAAGTHTYSAVATDGQGLTGTSNLVTVVVVAPTASGALLAPANNSFFVGPATITLLATAASSSGAVTQVQFFQNGSPVGTATQAPYSVTLTGVATGTYTFTAQVTDSTSTVTSSAATVTVGTASTLGVASPTDGTSIADDVIATLSGTLQAPPNSSVVVNNLPAAITSDGRFFVNNVPLLPGPNTVQVTLTEPNGTVTTQSLTIASTATQPFEFRTQLGPNIQASGLAPLGVQFSVSDPGGAPATSINLSCTNNGNVDFSVSQVDLSGAANSLGVCSYPGPGVYTALVTVINAPPGQAAQTVYTGTLTVVVQDPAALDAVLRSLWSGMNDALKAGDQPRALSYLDDPAKATYAPVYSGLAAKMPGIVASYSDLSPSILTGAFAEYSLMRTIQGTPQGFYIYFVNTTGVWQLDIL
jgi:uncharacterized repeat protein (TIGR01451 family)